MKLAVRKPQVLSTPAPKYPIIPVSSIPCWDGSFIGANVDISTIETSLKYTLVNGTQYVNCECRRIKSLSTAMFMTMADEIKVLFGVNKTGTHILKGHGEYLLLSRIMKGNGELLTLKVVPASKARRCSARFRDSVRRVFVYREVLGLNNTNEGSVLYDEPLGYHIYSTRETDSFLLNESGALTVLSGVTIAKWFNDISVDEMARKMFPGDVSDVIIDFSGRIDTIVRRLYPEMVTYGGLVTERLQSKLL